MSLDSVFEKMFSVLENDALMSVNRVYIRLLPSRRAAAVKVNVDGTRGSVAQ